MNKYNFDKIAQRKGTQSYKWDLYDSFTAPMWVADMDFYTPKEVKDAIIDRANNCCYGYSLTGTKIFEVMSNWWNRRYQANFKPEKMMFSTGVVAAISSLIKEFTSINDKVILLTPIYNHFYHTINGNSRIPLEVELRQNDLEYGMNFSKLEEAMKDPKATLMILCNPANPIGRIWSREELAKIGRLAKENNVLIFSDEIHCDITSPSCKYIPFSSVNEECKNNSITFIAPSKTFNLAGLKSACCYADNDLFDRALNRLDIDEVGDINYFSVNALIACYTKCEDWVDEMREYVYQNKVLLKELINKYFPEARIIVSKATYLAWADFTPYLSKFNYDDKEARDYIFKESGIYFCAGSDYGKGGKGFFRINLATNHEMVKKALDMLKKVLIT